MWLHLCPLVLMQRHNSGWNFIVSRATYEAGLGTQLHGETFYSRGTCANDLNVHPFQEKKKGGGGVMNGSRAGGFKIKLIICNAALGRICLTNVAPPSLQRYSGGKENNVSCRMLLCGFPTFLPTCHQGDISHFIALSILAKAWI